MAPKVSKLPSLLCSSAPDPAVSLLCRKDAYAEYVKERTVLGGRSDHKRKLAKAGMVCNPGNLKFHHDT